MKAVLGFLSGLGGLLSSLGGGSSSPAQGSAEELLEPARRGDARARNDLIHKYTPLVLRVGAAVSGRYLQVGRDEEVSVGLVALNEAIDRFDPERGSSFIAFSEMVIRRRMIDYYRRQRERGAEVPLSVFETADEEGNPLAGVEEREAVQRYTAAEEAVDRREEIERFARRLMEFGIRFADLVEESPKHEDARERAIAAAQLIVRNPILREHLLSRKELPLKALERQVDVSRKTLERQRRYIIAIALIMVEDFYHLRRYVAGYIGL